MKKKYFLLPLFIAFFCYSSFSQAIDPVIGFKNYKPKWIHLMFDSLNVDTTQYGIYTGLESFNLLNIIEVDSFAYISAHLRGKGMYVEKIDIKTGKKLWASDVSPDNWNEDFIEQPSNFYINKHGNIEVLTFRRITDDFFENYSVFGRRIYDSTSGELLYQYHAPVDDTLYPHLIYNFPIRLRAKLYPSADGTFEYVSCHYVNQEDHFYYYKLDSLGRELFHNQYFFPYDSNAVQHWYSDFKKLDDGSYVALKVQNNSKDHESDTSKYWLSYDYLDSKFNFIKSVRLKRDAFYTKENMYGNVLSSDIFVAWVANKISKLNYYFFDKNGELTDSVELSSNNGLPIFINSALLLRDGTICISVSTDNYKNPDIGNQYCIFHVGSDKKLIKSHCFDIAPPNHFIQTQSLHETQNGDILVNAKHIYNIFDPKFSGYDGWYSNWILFPGEDIGLKTGIDDIPINNNIINISPNPASEKILVEGNSEEIFQFQIFDILGREITKTYSSEIDISKMISGVYFVIALDKNSRFLGKTKFVKM